jgi:hypothetical protein
MVIQEGRRRSPTRVRLVFSPMTGGGYFWPIVGWGVGAFFHGGEVYSRPGRGSAMSRLEER